MTSVFICHASEDKKAIARPLALALREQHISVWYDEFEIELGDSLREKIEEGLVKADFGIVILSPSFFMKSWTKHELNGLVARQIAADGRTILLPIWHNIDHAGILKHSPPLADKMAVSSAEGLDHVVSKIVAKVRPKKSAILIAKEHMESLGFDVPSVTDDCWMEWAELKHTMFGSSAPYERWSFPLPFDGEPTNYESGMNIASAAMQLGWCHEAEKRKLSQLSHPELVHDFLRWDPSLFETARRCPGVLALYAPQLTIPGFDEGFAELFDALLDPENEDAYETPGYGGWDTQDGNEPVCGELIAWRHPQFGNLTESRLACSFVQAHTSDQSRYSHPAFECLLWLLADDSHWLPARIRDALLAGFLSRGSWLDSQADVKNSFVGALYSKTEKGFRWTPKVRAGLEELIVTGAHRVGLATSHSLVIERFIDQDFVGAWYREANRIAEARKRRSRS